MKVLHVIASPRGSASTTLQISATVLEGIKTKHPTADITHLDLFAIDLPAQAGANIES